MTGRATVGGIVALGLVAAGATAASPQEVPLPPSTAAQRAGLTLTVYNANLALVRETRRLDLPRGRVRLRLEGLPETLEPATVQAVFDGGAGAVRLLEQDHRRDLISPGRVLELSVGEPVTLLFDHGEAGVRRLPATLLSTQGGLVLETGEGVLLDPDARVEVPALPAGLVARPALEWLLDVERPGARTVNLTYLAGGLGWSADYVATLEEAGRRLHLRAWVTVDNATGGAFQDGRLRLVAGDVNRVSPPPLVPVMQEMARVRAMEADAGVPSFARQAVADTHVYSLEGTATLAPHAAKQIALHETAAVPAARRYVTGAGGGFLLRHLGPGEPQELPVEIRLEFENTSAAGLGLPLPAGVVRVYQAQAGGGDLFLGEDRLGHTPAGESVSLTIGRAFDLVAERRQTDYQDRTGIRRGSFEAAFEVTLRNRKDAPAKVEVRETVPGDWTVVDSSHPHRKLDVRTLKFELEVPAGGETVLTYRVRVS